MVFTMNQKSLDKEYFEKRHSIVVESLYLVQTPTFARSVFLLIFCVMIVVIVGLVFVPWQQNISGKGKVTNFNPGARPQTIEAQLSGRLLALKVIEGVHVRAGDTLVILQDLNVNFMDREFVGKVKSVRDNTIKSEELLIQTAKQRTVQAIQSLLAAEATLDNALLEIQTSRIRLTRADNLAKEGLISTRDVETATLNFQKAQADSIRAETLVEVAKRNVDAARFDENRIVQQADLRIQEVELRLENAVQRQGASVVLAPVDGVVVNITHVGLGQTVKEGEILARIVPISNDRAVELIISSRDAPIVEVGKPVRLQFSGFPAFVLNPGWQNFTFNTFGGKVAVIDALDDGEGNFRVLVVPDSTQSQGNWHHLTALRQGTPATGWILLAEVPIGFEIWRQLNGFPPVMTSKKSAKNVKPNAEEK